MIQEQCFYIDKTDFIREWWENRDKVTLIMRPRRFGKTLTMSMTEYFFSNQYKKRGDLFEDLSIWKEKSYRGLQGQYPVIALSFAGVKETSFLNARKKICQIITNLYNKYDFLLRSGYLNEKEREAYQKVTADMEDYMASDSLRALSDYLMRYYGKKVIILLDEYDTPMQMIGDWFQKDPHIYNGFIRALLQGDEKAMNLYMNKTAFATFSSFDAGKKPSDESEPERFYHGFVLGLMVDLADRYIITSNRESGFGRYDVMLEPLNNEDDAIILEFKVHSPDDGGTLRESVDAALRQIEEKQYAYNLEAKGIPSERIRRYGFAFEGKKVLIGS